MDTHAARGHTLAAGDDVQVLASGEAQESSAFGYLPS